MQNMINKAIIPVAGLGTRFLPATKAQPKEMLPIIDKPVIQFLVEEVAEAGLQNIIFVTGRGKRAIEDHFDFAPELENALLSNNKSDIYEKVRAISSLARFSYVRQKEPKGDGDAILCTRHLVGDNESVAVLFGDDVVDAPISPLKQIVSIFNKTQGSVVALDRVPKSEVSKFGVVKANLVGENLYEIVDIVEKPKAEEAPSDLVIAGKYIITPAVFAELENLKKSNQSGELRLSEALRNVVKKQKIYGTLIEGERYDCGSKLGFLKATVDFALKHEEVKDQFKEYLKGLIKKI
jgi:UTP--glucose-1-phosphate uridylyltransferase